MRIHYEEGLAWEGLSFVLEFARPLTLAEQEQVSSLIDAWYLLGVYGGYDGNLHYLSKVTYNSSSPVSHWSVDMGSARDRAVTVLTRALDGLAVQADIPFDTLRIGDPQINT
jgi:hypothetical protein